MKKNKRSGHSTHTFKQTDWKFTALSFVAVLAVILVVLYALASRDEPVVEKTTTSAPIRESEADHPPTPENEAWANEHLRDNWIEIERSYPIKSVRQEFVRVIRRIQRGVVVPNISVDPNPASPDVNCSADFDSRGKHRLTFYLAATKRIQAHVDHETFKDILIDCMVHENIHLEEQMLLQNPAATFTWEEFAAGEAEAWCLTTDRVLVPMRSAGRKNWGDAGRTEALAIYDQVGNNCRDPLWMDFGKRMSPYNPLGNYKP